MSEGQARIGIARRATYRPSIRSADFLILRHLHRFLHDRLERVIAGGARVVDIGCGEQPLRTMIERFGGRYIGVDLQQNQAGNVEIIAPIWKVPLADGSADVIVATEVIEHVSDVDGAFRELSRLLRPGGRLLLTTPFVYPLHEEPHDYGRLTASGVRWFASRHNLVVEEIATLGNEVEAMTLLWTNLWERLPRGKSLLLRKTFTLFRMALNVLSHAIALPISNSLDPLLPRKAYLSLVCILTRTA